jgi:hypothetical protein
MGERLFSPNQLSNVIEGNKRKLIDEVNEYDSKDFMRTDEELLRRYFVDKFKADPLELLEGQMYREEPKEVDVDVRHERFRDQFDPPTVRGVQHTIVVPFNGDGGLFGCCPSSYSSYKPNGTIRGSELRISYKRTDNDAVALKHDIEHDLGSIRQYVASINSDLSEYNKELPGRVTELINRRRDKIHNNARVGDTLNIPLRKRPEEQTRVLMPATRRQVEIRKPDIQSGPMQQEFFIAQQDYDYVLKTLKDMIAVMVRSPKTFAKMKEEELRDILLVILNAHYEGQATGETFNFNGATDILIRHAGKNVFIGECKVWHGIEEFLKALTQLLSYQSWHDTKAALLIFNRNKDTTAVLKKIDEELPRHASFKKDLGKQSENHFRYAFTQLNDKQREVQLAVLVFDVPGP